MNEIKKDIINNDIVIIAKDRSKRPKDKINTQIESQPCLEYEKNCPFCRGNEKYSTKDKSKIEDKSGWVIKSVENKFPILNNLPGDIHGVHEVIIDTYRHNGNFYNMNEKEFKDLITMYVNRYSSLASDKGVEYVSIFKNFLRKSGASLMHPHSQIISLSIVPPELENEINICNEYYEINKKSLYKVLVEDEIKYNKRIINNGDNFIVLVPNATKYSGEVRIIFKENIEFNEMTESNIEELANILQNLFKKLYEVRGYCPFNIYIHTHPLNMENKEIFNVHIHIVPRKYSFGGFELSTGMYVSSINPEEFAKTLMF